MASDALPSDPAAGRAARLAQAVASRICHDLVSPVGAIVNGVDLVDELGAAGREEISMIGASAARASALLELHRLAFGAGGSDGTAVARDALDTMAREVIATRRLPVAIDPGSGPDLARPAARLAALMLLAGRSVAGMRGELRLVLPAADPWPMRLAIATDTPAAAELSLRLAGPSDEPDPRSVEFDLLPLAAATAGARLTVEETPAALVIDARHP